jgi:hypothetical protein
MRRLTPTPRANRLSSDAPFSDRLLPDRMNGAGIGRPGAPSTAESTLFGRTSFLARTRRLVSPKPRPGRKRADQAPLIDFCNRREGRAHPRAARYPVRQRHSRGGRPSKATGGRHRLPGWESSSRAAGRFVPTKRRPKGREACSDGMRAPLSGNGSANIPGEGLPPTHAPRPAFDLPRER